MVKHESDLSTCESFGFETAGVDQGESTGMSIQEFNRCLQHMCIQVRDLSINVNAFHVLCFVELLHLPHPLATLRQLHELHYLVTSRTSFRSVRSHCQTHSLEDRPRVVPSGQKMRVAVAWNIVVYHLQFVCGNFIAC